MSSPLFKRPKENVKGRKTYSSLGFLIFSERECDLSLKPRAILPSKFFGAKRKVALRSEAYAWTPILRSFDKLCEVGVLFYLFYS